MSWGSLVVLSQQFMTSDPEMLLYVLYASCRESQTTLLEITHTHRPGTQAAARLACVVALKWDLCMRIMNQDREPDQVDCPHPCSQRGKAERKKELGKGWGIGK